MQSSLGNSHVDGSESSEGYGQWKSEAGGGCGMGAASYGSLLKSSATKPGSQASSKC